MALRDLIREILSGEFLKKGWFKEQLKIVVLIASLIFLYIYCDYLGQMQQHKLSTLQKELQDAHYIQTTLNAELVSSTRQSAISQSLSERGSKVKESKTAPTRIE